jgi:hypothetical protein
MPGRRRTNENVARHIRIVGGVAHHAWMEITTLETLGDSRAQVQQVESGEDSAMGVYARTLGANLPNDVRPLSSANSRGFAWRVTSSKSMNCDGEAVAACRLSTL